MTKVTIRKKLFTELQGPRNTDWGLYLEERNET